jgi:hypothetical protein
LTKAVALLDGADFKRLNKKVEGNSYGHIEFTSIDSQANWSLALSGSSVEKDERHDKGLETSLGLVRSDLEAFLPEKIKGETKCFYVPGSVGAGLKGVDDSFDNLPQIEYFSQFAAGDNQVVDADFEEFLGKVVSAYEKKISVVEENLSGEEEVVFVGFVFPDLLSHKHLYGATDDLVERLHLRFEELFEEHIFVSDHTCGVYGSDRSVPGKHRLPAELFISSGDSYYNLQKSAIHEFLVNWCND